MKEKCSIRFGFREGPRIYGTIEIGQQGSFK